MRIGILTTSFPTHDSDASGRFVYEMAEALRARGHRITVLAPAPNRQTPRHRSLSEHFDVHWVRYMPHSALQITFHGAGAPENLRAQPWALAGALGWVLASSAALRAHAESWDAIITHWAIPSALIANWIRPDLRHLAFVHSGEVHVAERLGWIGTHLVRQTARADTTAFVSSRIRTRYERLLGRRLDSGCVQPMGITLPSSGHEHCRARKLDSSTRSPRLVVLTMSRLVEIKNLDLVMDVAHSLPEIELCIAGEGPERSRLEHKAAKLGLEYRFLGTITGENKAYWLSRADIFVFASTTLSSGREEGAPVALREAMAAGLPVVATRTGAIPELVRDGVDGLVVSPDDRDSMRQALQRLARDEGLRWRLGQQARRSATRWSWTHVAERIEHLLVGASEPASSGATSGRPRDAPASTGAPNRLRA